MFATLIQKEIRAIISGPKFIATFLICSILILLSVFLGVQEYRGSLKSYHAGSQIAEEELQNLSSWSRFSMKQFRKPDPMQIFISGVSNDIGRITTIAGSEAIKLTNSAFSDDPIFAVFRLIDLNTIIMIILSLFAILFTYDAIAGEKENGTLKLAFSNSIPKLHYILAKFIGSWVGLIVPLIISILLSMLVVIVFRIPLSADQWTKTMMFLFVSVLYITFFMILGIFISTLTRQSNVAFLILLMFWVVSVLIVPRIGVMMAGKMIPVPSIAEIDGQIDRFSKDQRTNFIKNMEHIWQYRNLEMQEMKDHDSEQYRNDHMWHWIQEEDSLRREMQVKIDDFSRRVREELDNRKREQERCAFMLSRFSPVSAYQLCALKLAETDIHLKARYETSLENYKKTLLTYTDKKERETGSTGGIRVTFSSDAGMSINMGRNVTVDLSELPRFYESRQSLSNILHASVIDVVLLVLYILTALIGAIISFLKYDVR